MLARQILLFIIITMKTGSSEYRHEQKTKSHLTPATDQNGKQHLLILYLQPWIEANPQLLESSKPVCVNSLTPDRTTDCRAQELWLSFYTDFDRRRKVCLEKVKIIDLMADLHFNRMFVTVTMLPNKNEI